MDMGFNWVFMKLVKCVTKTGPGPFQLGQVGNPYP